jgi:inhibitor of KinA sporulation pathway (predicted exonuclease)
MIILDLEWNTGYGAAVRLDEILQIGAVKVEKLGAPIADTFCAYIRPQVHKRYSPAAELLPARQFYEASDLNFPQAYDAFLRWCGEDREFAAWGGDDLSVLRQSLDYWHLDAPLPQEIYDLQTAFLLTVGSAKGISLTAAVDYCGIPAIFDFHDALYDALYTCLVGEHIDPVFLTQAKRTPPSVPKKVAEKLAKRRPTRYGPFDTVEALLNNRGPRLSVCPVCGLRQRVSLWHHKGAGPYFGKFSCAHHGALILRLDVSQDSSHRYWATTRVLPPTPENKSLLKNAKAGESIPCHSASSAKKIKKRRYYHRSTKRGK